MLELPDNWTSAPIGDLITLNPKNSDVADETVAGFVPMQMVGVSFRAKVGFEQRPWHEIRKGYTHFQNGDVLLAKITPCFENGKAGFVNGLPNGIGAGSTEYFVCRANPVLLNARYLLAFMKTSQFVRDGAMQMTGSVGHKRVSKDYLIETALPLAPLIEQKRIADKLDALLMQVDACRNRLDNIPGIIKRFRQAVLLKAISNELTSSWREANQSMPWLTTIIEAVAMVGTGSTPLRSNPQYFANEGTPWVTSAATSQTLVVAANEYVTQAAIAAHRLKVYPVGTLLVAMYGEGKTRGQVTELGIPATINQACAAIVVNTKKAIPAYIKLVLQANYLEMREMAEGGNQPNLNLSKIKEFPLPLPPLPEQAEIVRRVEALFAFADRLEARYTAARAQVENLTPALLAKAFRGELVPQDPNDEPASALLARIQAQRGAPAKVKKQRASKM